MIKSIQMHNLALLNTGFKFIFRVSLFICLAVGQLLGEQITNQEDALVDMNTIKFLGNALSYERAQLATITRESLGQMSGLFVEPAKDEKDNLTKIVNETAKLSNGVSFDIFNSRTKKNTKAFILEEGGIFSVETLDHVSRSRSVN